MVESTATVDNSLSSLGSALCDSYICLQLMIQNHLWLDCLFVSAIPFKSMGCREMVLSLLIHSLQELSLLSLGIIFVR